MDAPRGRSREAESAQANPRPKARRRRVEGAATTARGPTPPRLRVLGLGNLLRSDDGVGVHLARALAGEPWPEHVRILDAGTPGVALLDLVQEAEHVLILDAGDFADAPATLRIFTPDEVRRRSASSPLSIHEADVLGVLRLGQALGIAVPVTLIAIQPQSLEPGTELSPVLAEAFPKLLACVRALIRSLCQ